MPALDAQFVRFTRRPWVGTCFFGFEEPVENMPQYGRDYGRVAGISALLLCTDLKPEQKEPLLVNFVQVGIDLGGMIRAGHPGLDAASAGTAAAASCPSSSPACCWTIRCWPTSTSRSPRRASARTSRPPMAIAGPARRWSSPGTRGSTRPPAWPARAATTGAPTSTSRPRKWGAGQNTSESYRRCCTSVGWVAQALALRLMHAEKAWNHDAFFDYVDRWMFENDAEFREDHQAGHRQGPRQGMGPPGPGLGRRSSTRCGSSTGRRSPRRSTAGSSRTTTATTARPSRSCSNDDRREQGGPRQVGWAEGHHVLMVASPTV